MEVPVSHHLLVWLRFAVRSRIFHFVPPPPILFTGIVELKASCLLSVAKGSTRYEMKVEPCNQM